MRLTVEERFWSKVEKTETCWIWTGAKNMKINGYGVIGTGGAGTKFRMTLAHRLSWIFAYGPIPDGINVLHKCDNPPCVNPSHLFLGSFSDNTMDMVRKGRGFAKCKGELHSRVKLSENDVRAIRNEYRKVEFRKGIGGSKSKGLIVPHSAADIAQRYNLHPQYVRNIIKRVVWKNVH